MSLASTLGSRFVLMAGGRITLLVLGLLAMGLLTRLLGPEGFGHFRAAVAFLGVAIGLADLGLASLFVREISVPAADQRRLIGNILGLRLVLAGSAMTIAIGAAFALPLHPQDRLGILGGAAGFLAYSAHLLLFGLFQQKLRQGGVVLAEISGGLIMLLLILLFARAGAEPWWFATAMGLSYVFTLIVTLIAAQRLVRFHLRLEPAIWWHLLKQGAPLAVIETLTVLYIRADMVLLAILQPPGEVGMYGVSSKVLDSFVGISLLFVGLFAPLLANTARSNAAAFQLHLRNALFALAVGGVGIALGIIALAPEVVRILAGSEFAHSVPILRLLAGLLVLRAATLILRETAIALAIQQRLLPAYAATTAVAIAAHVMLIPSFGGIGAALASLLAEMVLLVCLATLVVRATTAAVLRVPIMALACGLATSMLVLWLDAAGYNLLWRLASAAVVYLALLVATRSLSVSALLTFSREMFGATRGSAIRLDGPGAAK